MSFHFKKLNIGIHHQKIHSKIYLYFKMLAFLNHLIEKVSNRQYFEKNNFIRNILYFMRHRHVNERYFILKYLIYCNAPFT